MIFIRDQRAMEALVLGATAYRRAGSVAARHRNHEHAASCAATPPWPFVATSAEPYSAKAWAAISSAYRCLALARLETSPRLRAVYIDAAAVERRNARLYREQHARLRALGI